MTGHAEYWPDVDVIDPSEFEPEPTRPGVRTTTAELAVEAEVAALVRTWLLEEEVRHGGV